MAYFIGKFLGPKFEKENIQTEIFFGTINRDNPQYTKTALDDPAASKYIKGVVILLVAGILTAGRTINGVAVQMSGRIVRHISEYHYRLLQVEFERSEGVLDASVQFMRQSKNVKTYSPSRMM